MSLSDDLSALAIFIGTLHLRGDIPRADVSGNLLAKVGEFAERARALERLTVPFEGRTTATGDQVVSLDDARRDRRTPPDKPEGGSR